METLVSFFLPPCGGSGFSPFRSLPFCARFPELSLGRLLINGISLLLFTIEVDYKGSHDRNSNNTAKFRKTAQQFIAYCYSEPPSNQCNNQSNYRFSHNVTSPPQSTPNWISPLRFFHSTTPAVGRSRRLLPSPGEETFAGGRARAAPFLQILYHNSKGVETGSFPGRFSSFRAGRALRRADGLVEKPAGKPSRKKHEREDGSHSLARLR